MRLKPTRLLLALIAVFAMSAITSAAASAAKPEFKPVPTKKKFTSTSGRSTWGDAAEEINCTKGTASGEITSATTVGDVIVKYTGCSLRRKLTQQECPIKSTTGGAEEILTTTLKGELGVIVPKPTSGSEVGLLLQPKEKTAWYTLESKCGGLQSVSGSLAGLVNMPHGTTGTIIYSSPDGDQAIKEMTMDSGTVVKPRWTSGGELWTVEATDSLKFEEALEVT